MWGGVKNRSPAGSKAGGRKASSRHTGVLACKEGAILAREEGEQERRDKALLLGLLRLRLQPTGAPADQTGMISDNVVSKREVPCVFFIEGRSVVDHSPGRRQRRPRLRSAAAAAGAAAAAAGQSSLQPPAAIAVHPKGCPWPGGLLQRAW